jgi:phosphatidylglycerophosphatase C
MKLILFDFDGTLTTKDSLIDFLRFATSKRKFNKALTKYFFKLVAYKIRLYNGERLKKEILSFFFKGRSIEELQQLGRSYNRESVSSIIRNEIMEQLLQFQKGGHEICLVSASMDIWLKPFCEDLNIECICTEMEFISDVYSGIFATPNCNYEQKRIRVEEKYNLQDYDEVIAYGNSKGDFSLFEMADLKVRV